MIWIFAVAIVFFVFVVIITLNSKKIIGLAGEFWVKEELAKLPSEYLVINDVMLKVDNKTTQVDHVVISQYGIFVIETKQINGKIYGNDYNKDWTVYAGGQKYILHNPIHQNYRHVQVLKEVLKLNEEYFIPIVCISSQAKLKINSKQVVQIYNLIDRIKSYKKEILPEYIDIYKTLEFLNMTSKDSKEAHINRTKQYVKEKGKETDNKCPKCGGNLVIRNGKYNKFIGCSNYPKCKFTKQIK